MAEMTHEELQARYADVMAEGGSYRRLQVALDEALQKNADLAAAHARYVEELQAEHDRILADQAATLKSRHEEAVAELKASVLVPALADLHARQAKDLADRQRAELERLKAF